MQRTFPCHAAGSSLLLEVGVSHGKPQRTLRAVSSAALGTTQKTQHKEKDLHQQSGHFKCI